MERVVVTAAGRLQGLMNKDDAGVGGCIELLGKLGRCPAWEVRSRFVGYRETVPDPRKLYAACMYCCVSEIYYRLESLRNS